MHNTFNVLKGDETLDGASLKERLPHIRNFYLYVS